MKAIQKSLKNKHIGTKVSAKEYEKIIKLVKSGEYLSVSDFVREAIREKLNGVEIIELRDIDYVTAKKEIFEYYRDNERAYPTDVATNLRLELDLVYKVVNELIEEGSIVVIE